MFIDTHCHLPMMIDASENRTLSNNEIRDISDVIESARADLVTHIITIATNEITSKQSLQLAEYYPTVSATVGIHPCDVTNNWHTELANIDKLIRMSSKRPCAIGECGLDFYRPGFDKNQQHEALCAQIERAIAFDLPLVIHSRNALDETLDVLNLYKSPKLRGIIHCFSGSAEHARRSIELGFYLGIGGTITYPKNDTLRTIVQTVGLEHILLETDAPFLPPQIIRGKQNHPLHIATIAQAIANLIECSPDYVGKITSTNARALFKIPLNTEG